MALRKRELVNQNGLKRDLSLSLLSALAEGRRQQTESIGVSLDMNQGGMVNCFDIVRCHFFL